MKAKGPRNGSWWKVEANKALQGAGTQPLQTYLDRRQATLAEWATRERESPGAMAETGGSIETDEGHSIRYFGGDGNMAGVERAKEELRGRALTATGEGEARDYRYDGTDTGDAWVGG